MTERDRKRNARLREQCEVVAALIASVRPVYEAATQQQRALLETIIGAAIWYIPKPVGAWTGQISIGALRAFHPDSGISRPRLSEEHVYPRKVAARLLLADTALDGESLARQFSETFGRVHLITSEENKAVQPYQRAGVFKSAEEAYSLAGIAFVTLPARSLRKVRKRDRETIQGLLDLEPGVQPLEDSSP